MIKQSKEEVAEAMREDPETWAELYLQLMSQIALYEAMLTKIKNSTERKH